MRVVLPPHKAGLRGPGSLLSLQRMWLQTHLPGREAPVGHGGCRGMEAPFWPLSESNTAGHSPAKAPGACTRPFWDVHPLEVKVRSSRSSRSSKSKHGTATAQGPLPGPQPAKTHPQKPCKPSKYVHPHPVSSPPVPSAFRLQR